jgi:DNA/RNA-binding domain of Phe-tRNA-synthetase-like protein
MRQAGISRQAKHRNPETGGKGRDMKGVRISERCLEVYPWMKFGYCLVKDLSAVRPSGSLTEEQKETEAYIRSNSERLMERAKSISRFYKVQGEKNRSHIESLIKSISNGKNIKPVNFIVDSVMIAEMRNALLLGIHDLDRIDGDVVLDVASEGESFMGIGQRTITARQNEIVLRDDSGIWASYTQGPDARTVIDAASRNVMILGFFTPETSREVMIGGIRDAVECLLGTAKGGADEVRVIP